MKALWQDDFCMISYYVLGIKSFVRLYLMEKNTFLVSAYLHCDFTCILLY